MVSLQPSKTVLPMVVRLGGKLIKARPEQDIRQGGMTEESARADAGDRIAIGCTGNHQRSGVSRIAIARDGERTIVGHKTELGLNCDRERQQKQRRWYRWNNPADYAHGLLLHLLVVQVKDGAVDIRST